jgi:hypothetical protein
LCVCSIVEVSEVVQFKEKKVEMQCNFVCNDEKYEKTKEEQKRRNGGVFKKEKQVRKYVTQEATKEGPGAVCTSTQ